MFSCVHLKCLSSKVLMKPHGQHQRLYSFWWTGQAAEKPKFKVVSPQERLPIVDISKLPEHITQPDYALTGGGEVEYDSLSHPPIPVWSPEEIECIRRASRLARKMINLSSNLISPGLTTDSLNTQIHEEILRHNAYPSTLNFQGFPKSIATSVNNVAAHGVPDSRPLEDGDIVTVDITVYTSDGFHGDCSQTFLVGPKLDKTAMYLSTVAQECLYAGLSVCGPHVPFHTIGHSIRKQVKRRRLNVIPQLCGHGIGKSFHCPPDIYHTLNNYPGSMLPGMVFTIEPCVSEGGTSVQVLEDGWTITTKDNSRTAQFEHTILINEVGIEILTL